MAKIGCAINMFDEAEMLDPLINNIIACGVNYIAVIYQDVSYNGKIDAMQSVEPILKSLKTVGAIDAYACFKPQPRRNMQEVETDKRNLCLDVCRDGGCDYFQCRDVDEYFRPSEFESAAKVVEQNGYDITACQYYVYLLWEAQLFRHKSTTPDLCTSPFLYRISQKTIFRNTSVAKYGLLMDGTRYTEPAPLAYLFPENEVCMHHMMMVRPDVKRKILLKSDIQSQTDFASRRRQQMLKKSEMPITTRDHYHGREVIPVQDEFGVVTWL